MVCNFHKYKIVAFLQLCNGLHKDWHCPWKPSRLQGDELTSAFSFQFFFSFSGGDHLSILLWRVQPGGGAFGKVEVERGAGKWRDRLRSGRSRTRWGCRVQVSFSVWVDSRHLCRVFKCARMPYKDCERKEIVEEIVRRQAFRILKVAPACSQILSEHP